MKRLLVLGLALLCCGCQLNDPVQDKIEAILRTRGLSDVTVTSNGISTCGRAYAYSGRIVTGLFDPVQYKSGDACLDPTGHLVLIPNKDSL